MNIGVLPVKVSAEFLDHIYTEVEKNPQTQLEVNLQNQSIQVQSSGMQETFDINSYKKNNLLHGYDDIDYLMAMKEEIQEFATTRPF